MKGAAHEHKWIQHGDKTHRCLSCGIVRASVAVVKESVKK